MDISKTFKNNKNFELALKVIAVLIVLFIIYRILSKVGLVKTIAQKADEKKASGLSSIDWFNPMKQEGAIFKRLGDNQAANYSKQLYDASHWLKSWLHSDSGLILSIFGQLSNKYQISEIAKQYYKIYGNDLRADITYHMNDAEKAQLYNIVDNMQETT